MGSEHALHRGAGLRMSPPPHDDALLLVAPLINRKASVKREKEKSD